MRTPPLSYSLRCRNLRRCISVVWMLSVFRCKHWKHCATLQVTVRSVLISAVSFVGIALKQLILGEMESIQLSDPAVWRVMILFEYFLPPSSRTCHLRYALVRSNFRPVFAEVAFTGAFGESRIACRPNACQRPLC